MDSHSGGTEYRGCSIAGGRSTASYKTLYRYKSDTNWDHIDTSLIPEGYRSDLEWFTRITMLFSRACKKGSENVRNLDAI